MHQTRRLSKILHCPIDYLKKSTKGQKIAPLRYYEAYRKILTIPFELDNFPENPDTIT